MKKTMIFSAALVILLFGSSCFAFQPSIIGGIRDGIALGLMLESGPANGATLRMGLEANTSNVPGIVFVGGKWPLRNVSGRFPMSLSGGLVGYLGNNSSQAGPYISVIFDRFLDVSPLSLEFGIDVVNFGRLQCQLGYQF
jgi:hypothetical protein